MVVLVDWCLSVPLTSKNLGSEHFAPGKKISQVDRCQNGTLTSKIKNSAEDIKIDFAAHHQPLDYQLVF